MGMPGCVVQFPPHRIKKGKSGGGIGHAHWPKGIMATARINQMMTSVAGFLSGAETARPTSPEYLEVDVEEKPELFLVTYGPYGILPSFDPDCLATMVPVPCSAAD